MPRREEVSTSQAAGKEWILDIEASGAATSTRRIVGKAIVFTEIGQKERGIGIGARPAGNTCVLTQSTFSVITRAYRRLKHASRRGARF